jgi:hypothetical protein
MLRWIGMPLRFVIALLLQIVLIVATIVSIPIFVVLCPVLLNQYFLKNSILKGMWRWVWDGGVG